MVPPVRWYHLLSAWIFILSALYPIHKISTFPLNVIALTGCLEAFANREHIVKSIYILFLHLAPFAWIPYDLSRTAIGFALATMAVYVVFIYSIKEQPVDIYRAVLSERHTTVNDFLADRFGIH
jgi:hypothetical protein